MEKILKYNILLFDADNTILDFDRSEEQALSRAFRDMGLNFSQHSLEVYREKNMEQWHLFELGKQTKADVLRNRFDVTFCALGLPVELARQTGDLYEHYLMQGYYVLPHAKVVLNILQKHARLYLVSNGVVTIQNSRMKGSGMEKYFLSRFVSEEVGYPKPQKQYFDYCFEHIGNVDKSKVLIVGDSLTSDIQGGVNAQIDTCWFNPKHILNTSNLVPTYEIDDLLALLNIVGLIE